MCEEYIGRYAVTSDGTFEIVDIKKIGHFLKFYELMLRIDEDGNTETCPVMRRDIRDHVI